jgi:hypothetical protein
MTVGARTLSQVRAFADTISRRFALLFLTMRLTEWLDGVFGLHDRARQGTLVGPERATYLLARRDVSQLILTGHLLTLKPGESPRRSLRVVRALRLDLELPPGQLVTETLDVSVGGCSTIVPEHAQIGDQVRFKLHLGMGSEPVAGTGWVVGSTRLEDGDLRLSLRFEEVSAAHLDLLELLVFDAVVQKLRADSTK